jgi:hypothetical protein
MFKSSEQVEFLARCATLRAECFGSCRSLLLPLLLLLLLL